MTEKRNAVEVYRAIFGDCINHQHTQVGPCVYCMPCGRRLYQGTRMTPEELSALREWFATEPAGDPS